MIQLREQRAAPATFFDDAIEATRLAHQHGAKLIINDRVDVALAVNADGVHLGQDDLPVGAARRLLGEESLIGFSTHNLEQVKAALDLPIDYLAFGPVFTTSTKHRPDPVVGIERLAEVARLTRGLPLVAIGGITQSTLRAVLDSGAGAVALISAVLAAGSDITENLRNLTAQAESAT